MIDDGETQPIHLIQFYPHQETHFDSPCSIIAAKRRRISSIEMSSFLVATSQGQSVSPTPTNFTI
jgi:kynurenine formamidase